MTTRLDAVYRFPPPPPEDVSEAWAPATMDGTLRLRSALRAALARRRWSPEAAGRVLLAVTEALANAVEHGSAPGGRIGLAYRVSADAARVEVTDRGRPGAAAPCGELDRPALESECGRGRVLMRALSEGFETTRAGEGTRVTLEFARLGSLAAA